MFSHTFIISLVLLFLQKLELFLELVSEVQELRPFLLIQLVHHGLQHLLRVFFAQSVQISLQLLNRIFCDKFLSFDGQLELFFGCFSDVLCPQLGNDIGWTRFGLEFDFARVWNDIIFITNLQKFATCF